MAFGQEQSEKGLSICSVDCMEGMNLQPIFLYGLERLPNDIAQVNLWSCEFAVLAYSWLGELPIHASAVPRPVPQLCGFVLVFTSQSFSLGSISWHLLFNFMGLVLDP